ncbi:MAG: hypothetical protein KatS3mg043_0593 [Rhodothermaceae bacterium]|nr:MAG: hypothetical protein KatS3mg043_0593 [Rhodothermaceae bacterium]
MNFALREEIVQGEEIVVTAERPVVQPDLSASMATRGSRKPSNGYPWQASAGSSGYKPVSRDFRFAEAVATNWLSTSTALTLRDERNNAPYTSLSLAAVQEVQVQTGGFNAEYGNVPIRRHQRDHQRGTREPL